jgi:hypothetical protein
LFGFPDELNPRTWLGTRRFGFDEVPTSRDIYEFCLEDLGFVDGSREAAQDYESDWSFLNNATASESRFPVRKGSMPGKTSEIAAPKGVD